MTEETLRSFYVAGTDINTFVLCAILIAIGAFFSRPTLSAALILIFIYLLPRAGFIISTKWYYYPLPAGYLLVAFLMVKWFFSSLTSKDKINAIRNPVRRLFSIYIIISLFGVILGLLNGGKISTMLLEAAIYCGAFFVFTMVLNTFNSKDCAEIFMNGILVCGFLVSIYGILLLICGKSLLINNITYSSSSYYALIGQFINAKRTISSYGDPNALSAQLMVFCSIFASLLLLTKQSVFKRIFLTLGLIASVVCIYFASSRASLIGLFVLLIIFAMTRIKKMWLYIPILAGSYLICIEPMRKYYEHRIYAMGIIGDSRMELIKTFFVLLTRIPFGVGFGNYIDDNFNVIPAENIWYGLNSFYLHIFTRIGVQGLAIFTLMLFFILRYLFVGIKHIEDPSIRYFVFGAACGIIVQQFNFMANNVYHVPGGMLNFWVMCGMLTVIVNLYRQKGEEAS